jgi:hypothetical protein
MGRSLARFSAARHAKIILKEYLPIRYHFKRFLWPGSFTSRNFFIDKFLELWVLLGQIFSIPFKVKRMLNIHWEAKSMKRGVAFRAWVYLLCVSFLLLTNGFHTMVAEAKEIGRPVGEMVSSGEVKFESRENVWKNVELSHFPIFQGVRIKTEKGASMLTLADNSQIEVGQNSLYSFDRNDQMHLTRGTIDFRLPSTAALSFKVGDLTVIKSKSLQASKNPSAVSSKSEETIGSISIHPNGAVTVKSIQGSLSIMNQEHVVLAALSSKDTLTIPSVATKSPPKVMMAQAGETTGGPEAESKKFLGIGTWGWVAIIGGVVVVGVIAGVAAGGGGGGGGGGAVPVAPAPAPVCP